MSNKQLKSLLKALRLRESLKHLDEIVLYSGKESLDYEEFLTELLTRELDTKTQNKIDRLLKESKIDLRKSLDAFEINRLNPRLRGQVKNLLRGEFLERKENVIAFGNPGSGKTHLLLAICQELCKMEHRILFKKCDEMVEFLLIQKNNLTLSDYLKKLDKYELVFLDDIGYVQKSKEEMEVLFSLLAHRYERGSVMISSNLVFSKWEQIFKDPMTTVAVVDRVVHHSVVLEMNLPSFRVEEADKGSS